MSVNIVLVGPGAFGKKHLKALSNIADARVVSIVSPNEDQAEEVAETYGVPFIDPNLELALQRSDADAFILATPTHLHARQAAACLDAGKHVCVEIPAGDNWPEIQALAEKQIETGLVCMVGHTRRYNPSHQWVQREIAEKRFQVQHMQVETFFFRRENTNALGEPRDWTDHLLWHHAAHTIDLFSYQCGETISEANALVGPTDPNLGIAMDLSIQAKTPSGKLLTLALSFNNDGPLGTTFRYIGDTGTYIAHYDDLKTGRGETIDVSEIDVSQDGVELQDRDFISAIKTQTEPRASIANVLPCYQVLHQLELQITSRG